jgi:hypothetical protein
MTAENEKLRNAAEAKAIEYANAHGEDWGSFHPSEKEARILTQGHRIMGWDWRRIWTGV